jgi:hypothetical protein
MNERIKELARQAAAVEGWGPEVWQTTFSEKFAELIVKQCGYYADIFEAAGCPVDMDLTETKPSDYIKRQMSVE